MIKKQETGKGGMAAGRTAAGNEEERMAEVDKGAGVK